MCRRPLAEVITDIRKTFPKLTTNMKHSLDYLEKWLQRSSTKDFPGKYVTIAYFLSLTDRRTSEPEMALRQELREHLTN